MNVRKDSIVLFLLAMIGMTILLIFLALQIAPEPPAEQVAPEAPIEDTAEARDLHIVPMMAAAVEPEPEAVTTVCAADGQQSNLQLIDAAELELLACVIYQEAGSDNIADETRYMVGDVVLNRVADTRFPDTLDGVLRQRGQYGRFYWTGVVWPDRAKHEPEAVKRSYNTAMDLLSGKRHSAIYGAWYIWQAEFAQGFDVILADGLYFGR